MENIKKQIAFPNTSLPSKSING